MKFLLLFALLSAPSAKADDACSSRVRQLDGAILRAENPASDGQIEACIPAGDPSKKTSELVKSNEAAAKAYAAAYQRYLAAKTRAEKISADLNSSGGSICGATAEVKKDVSDLEMAVINESANMETQDKIIGANEYAFNMQYVKGRTVSMLKARVTNPKACANTATNAANLSKAFSQVGITCAGLYSGSGTAVQSLQTLTTALRGCASAN